MAFGLGSIVRSVMNPINLAQLAMGPAGWASFAMRTIGAQIGMNLIQQLGQRMGLPQPMIDMAQSAFASSAGMPGLARQEMSQAIRGVADSFNLGFRDIAMLENAANRDIDNGLNSLLAANSETQEQREARSRRGGSWLMAIAETLGRKLDAKAAKLEKMAGKLDDDKPSATAKFSAESQRFSMLFNSTNTAIKTIGEAMSRSANKQ